MGGGDAVTSEKWKFIGNIPLEEDLLKNPSFYSRQEYRETEVGPLLEYYRIYDNGSYRKGTAEEVTGMEYDFVWDERR